MSIDWIVTWSSDPEEVVPTSQVIGEVLEDFLGGLLEHLQERDRGFWIATLKGTKSYMFRRHGGRQNIQDDMVERWFEVWVYNDNIVITTRMQDDVTNCLAAEFARRCAQRWGGTLDEPS